MLQNESADELDDDDDELDGSSDDRDGEDGDLNGLNALKSVTNVLFVGCIYPTSPTLTGTGFHKGIVTTLAAIASELWTETPEKVDLHVQ
jgi:hypothetical protein